MKTISSQFNQAARGNQQTGFSLFWLAVLAIAILDDSDKREKDSRRSREDAPSPKPN